MQFTTAFAPTEDDLAEDFFGTPVISMTPPPPEADEVNEAEWEEA